MSYDENLLEKLSFAIIVMVFGIANANAQGYIFTESDETVVMEAEHYYSLKEGSVTLPVACGMWKLLLQATQVMHIYRLRISAVVLVEMLIL